MDREGVWSEPFDTAGLGVLKAIWGAGAEDVFMVGGTSERGEVHHFDGESWQAMDVPEVPLLLWVFGFGPNQVYSVGQGGAVIQYDGESWVSRDSGTAADLQGIWGGSPSELWIVGGEVGGGEPVILNFDATAEGASGFSQFSVPSNDRSASALFSVWGIGSKTFAVGSGGLIIEFDAEREQWSQSPTGPAANDDFIAMWGTSENNIVAVGGRSGGRISVYDGRTWTTELVSNTSGLNAVFMVRPDQAILGGPAGYVADFDPIANTLTLESSGTIQTVHAIWADDPEQFYAVGGTDSGGFSGLTLVRTLQEPGTDTQPPDETPEPPDETPEPPDDTPPPPTGVATLEMGIIDIKGDYAKLEDGDDLALVEPRGGFPFVVVTFRATGFEPFAEVSLSGGATLAEDGTVIASDIHRVTESLFEVEPGINELFDFPIDIDNADAADVRDKDAVFSFTITATSDPTLTASVTQTVHLARARTR